MNFRKFTGSLCAALLFTTVSLTAHGPDPDLRHWEIAGPDPDRIFLSFYGDPATGRAVTWRTGPSVTEAWAEIAPATANPKFDKSSRRLLATTHTPHPQLHPSNKQGPVRYHSVIFEDLEPDKLYAYRVGSEDHWSEWIQFRTARTDAAPFSFVYFGDAQNEILDKWSRVIRMSFQKAPEAAFAIHAGDLVDNGHMDRQWAEWFEAGGWIHRQRTGVPVIGNHEFRPIPGLSKEKVISLVWRPQFTLPEAPGLPQSLQETVYTVDYQGLRIIALNSLVEPELQAAYLREQLQRPGANWTEVTSHYSIFTPRADRPDYASSKLWLSVVEEFGVDLVLQGHDHSYLRGHQPRREASGAFGGSFQTLFVTSTSGPTQYALSQERVEGHAALGYSQDKGGEQSQYFQVIEVDVNTVTYSAYTADGQLFDRAVITKDPETGLKKLENR